MLLLAVERLSHTRMMEFTFGDECAHVAPRLLRAFSVLPDVKSLTVLCVKVSLSQVLKACPRVISLRFGGDPGHVPDSFLSDIDLDGAERKEKRVQLPRLREIIAAVWEQARDNTVDWLRALSPSLRRVIVCIMHVNDQGDFKTDEKTIAVIHLARSDKDRGKRRNKDKDKQKELLIEKDGDLLAEGEDKYFEWEGYTGKEREMGKNEKVENEGGDERSVENQFGKEMDLKKEKGKEEVLGRYWGNRNGNDSEEKENNNVVEDNAKNSTRNNKESVGIIASNLCSSRALTFVEVRHTSNSAHLKVMHNDLSKPCPLRLTGYCKECDKSREYPAIQLDEDIIRRHRSNSCVRDEGVVAVATVRGPGHAISFNELHVRPEWMTDDYVYRVYSGDFVLKPRLKDEGKCFVHTATWKGLVAANIGILSEHYKGTFDVGALKRLDVNLSELGHSVDINMNKKRRRGVGYNEGGDSDGDLDENMAEGIDVGNNGVDIDNAFRRISSVEEMIVMRGGGSKRERVGTDGEGNYGDIDEAGGNDVVGNVDNTNDGSEVKQVTDTEVRHLMLRLMNGVYKVKILIVAADVLEALFSGCGNDDVDGKKVLKACTELREFRIVYAGRKFIRVVPPMLEALKEECPNLKVIRFVKRLIRGNDGDSSVDDGCMACASIKAFRKARPSVCIEKLNRSLMRWTVELDVDWKVNTEEDGVGNGNENKNDNKNIKSKSEKHMTEKEFENMNDEEIDDMIEREIEAIRQKENEDENDSNEHIAKKRRIK